MSAPRLQDWPIPACTPDSGRITPIFSGPPCARTMLNGAVPASNPAPAPAAKLRRVTPARAGFVGDLRIIEVLPGYGDQPSRALFLLLFNARSNGHERAFVPLEPFVPAHLRIAQIFAPSSSRG